MGLTAPVVVAKRKQGTDGQPLSNEETKGDTEAVTRVRIDVSALGWWSGMDTWYAASYIVDLHQN